MLYLIIKGQQKKEYKTEESMLENSDKLKRGKQLRRH